MDVFWHIFKQREKEGEIKVRFSAPWLKDEVLKILVQ